MAQQIALQALGASKRIISEDNESSHDLISQPKAYLALDPLDGTDVYLCSDAPDYGVMLGWVSGGQPQQGVILLPARNNLLFFADSFGANTQDLNTLACKHFLPLNRTFIGVSLNAKNDPQLYQRGYERLRSKAAGVLSYGSNAAGFAALLQGHIGAYVCISGKPKNIWEFAAGDAITRIAGGVSSDHDGKPLVWNQPRVIGIWSASQDLHKEILEAVQA